MIVLGYWLNWSWVGVNGGYSKTTMTSTIHGITTAKEQPQTRTLWDWMQLLLVPIMLAIGGFWLNHIQKSRDERVANQRTKAEQDAAKERAQTDREIASDNQREAAVQVYLDRMSELLLKENLRYSKPDAEIRNIARVRTLNILQRLNGIRKANVLRFLYEAHLIDKDNCILRLEGADFSDAFLGKEPLIQGDVRYSRETPKSWFNKETVDTPATTDSNVGIMDLHGVNLSRVNLASAILNEVNLVGADLIGVDLSDAHLWNADLTSSDLSGANLSSAELFEAELSKANLRGINLQFAHLNNADLTEANLSHAHVYKVDLSEADVIKANLSDAILQDADLNFTDLTGANLIGADLRHALGV